MQSGKSMPMQSETRLERRLDRAVARAITPRGAAIVIASASIVITFGSAFLMTLARPRSLPVVRLRALVGRPDCDHGRLWRRHSGDRLRDAWLPRS